MGIIFKFEERRVIPKWRSLETAENNNELKSTAKKEFPKPFELTLLDNQRKVFIANKSLENAGDLLSSAYVLGLEQEFRDVADYILNKDINEGSSLVFLAKKVLDVDMSTDLELDYNDTINIQLKSTFGIAKYKAYLKEEPRNPLAWIELGRLYSQINKKDKAKRCINTALSLDSDNRFIVRSASRFYHHLHPDADKALSIIRKSKFIDSDPWLMSAEIAYSSIGKRHSTSSQKGINYLKHRKYSDFEITELASALGTLELLNGKTKSAKRYFEQSLIQPNDNSIAQARWMSEEIRGVSVDDKRFNLKRAFEADSILAFEKGKYNNAFQNALSWNKDEPYSTRPIKLASYLAGVFLDDNEESIQLLKRGLCINPDDVMLNNNLVYFLVRGGNIQEAIKIYRSKLYNKGDEGNNVSKLTVTATTGLLFYREGLRDRGREFYQEAIKRAKATGNEYLVALATVNYCKEEVRFIRSKSDLASQVSYLAKYIKKNESPDVEIFYNELLAEYNKLSD